MVKILWVDDEVELLKPHVLFLTQKGYEVDTCNNGYDAIDMASEGAYDLIILDEMMPGMTGLETLPKIKEVRPTTPVIMVTKSEEENIMDKAVGSKIADYLIKPVNPNQVLLSIKKKRPPAAARHRADHGRLPLGVRAHHLVAPAGRDVPGLVFDLPPAHRLGDRAFGILGPEHPRGALLPERRGQSGVLQIRPPQLLQLDQPPHGGHAHDVAYAHADENLPRGRRESQDDAAADRQLPLRPVAFRSPRCCAATTTWCRTISTAPSFPRPRNTPATPSSPG